MLSSLHCRSAAHGILCCALLLASAPSTAQATDQAKAISLAERKALRDRFHRIVHQQPDSALSIAAAYAVHAQRTGTLNDRAIAASMHGQVWSIKGHRAKALPHFLEALDHYTALRDTSGMAMLHGNVGGIHLAEHRFAMAHRELELALNGFTRTREHEWAAGILVLMGEAYEGLGARDSAKANYARGAAALRELGLLEHASITDRTRAGLLLEEGNEAEALALVRAVSADSTPGLDNILECDLLLTIGQHAAELGQFGRADTALRRALHIASIAGFDRERAEAHLAISELHRSAGSSDSALVHLHHHMQWKDSLDSHRTASSIAEIQHRHDAAQQEATMQAIVAQHDARSARYMAGLALLVVLAAALSIGYWQRRRSNRLLEQRNTTIANALQEREVMLRELHHRVKNNLQTMTSLLRMQQRSMRDEEGREAIGLAMSRVRSMALVHQDLYRKPGLTMVDMPAFLQRLASTLLRAHGAEERVRANIECPVENLDVDVAITLGLIVNEAITNALKHAFPEQRNGSITVRLLAEGDELQLQVRDDGIGYEPALVEVGEGEERSGVGIIGAMAAALHAEVNIQRSEGTVMTLRFRTTTPGS